MNPSEPDCNTLAEAIAGSVSTALADRRLVAQDASPYRVLPAAVVVPRTPADCRIVVDWARERGIALIPRGGGTGLAGQCVGSGVVVDLTRHFTAIDEYDPESGTIRVQPGVTCGALNRALAGHGRMFGPDPSTVTRATLGGMLGNNAWGPHAPVDGTTRDNVVAVEAVLADGRAVTLKSTSDAGKTDAGESYPATRAAVNMQRQQDLLDLLYRYREPIEAVYPATDSGLCSNNGYPLYQLLRQAPFRADGVPFNEAQLFAGAEGTLGLVTAITLRTRPLRTDRCVLCPHFPDVASALAAVPAALAAGACAAELLDAHLLELTRTHPAQAANRFWLEGSPGAVLLIEFADGRDPGELPALLRNCGATAVPMVSEDVERVWALRRAALGLLMGRSHGRRAVTAFEDTAVRVEHLPAYAERFGRLLAAEGVEAVHYGSVSLGLLHLRPLLDLGDADDRARFRRLLDGQAALVREFRGVWSTKHGDGRLRAPWLETVLGREAMAAMRAVKTLYDPEGLFNPGKILDAPDPLTDLRAAESARAPASTGFDWSDDAGLVAAAGRCQGAGACRQRAADGGLCPTWHALREDRHATRGRATLFQQALASANPQAELAGDDLHAALGLCLACKTCQHECPARVDMARLKAEALYQRQRVRGATIRQQVIAAFARLSGVAATVPRLANAITGSTGFTRLVGVSGPLPRLATRSLPRRLGTQTEFGNGPRGPLVLALDPHTAWYEPDIGEAAIRVLTAIGYRVHVSPVVSLGRPAISQGMLDHARAQIARATRSLDAAGPTNAPVVGLEPSEVLTLRDEAPALMRQGDRSRVMDVAARALTLEEFLAGEGAEALAAIDPGSAGQLAFHVHCHARAASDPETTTRLFERLPGTVVHRLRVGCCGMAGAFGYVEPEVSRAVFDSALGPAIAALDGDVTLVAAGTSCRQQMARFSGRRALHPAEVLARVLPRGD